MVNSEGKHRFNFNWNLFELESEEKVGKVFSCFSGGGGSSMGYKLAGLDVIGCCETDKMMYKLYNTNLKVKYGYNMMIQDFKNIENVPEELFDLDILDGSPPCTPFSIAGKGEETWGVEKKFREGQKMQVIDRLFFDFIDIAERLKPKIVIAENVVGLTYKRSKHYVEEIVSAFERIGYVGSYYILDASTMGVPQRRKRVFFIYVRKDLVEKYNIELVEPVFNEEPILASEIIDFSGDEIVTEGLLRAWNGRKYGDSSVGKYYIREYGKETYFYAKYVYHDSVCNTLIGKKASLIHYDQPRYLGVSEICKVSSFPIDYNFCGRKPHYVCGMSVPPVMMANIASFVKENILDKIK